MHVARTLSRLNKDMTFCYISGAGTGGKWMAAMGKSKSQNRK